MMLKKEIFTNGTVVVQFAKNPKKRLALRKNFFFSSVIYFSFNIYELEKRSECIDDR